MSAKKKTQNADNLVRCYEVTEPKLHAKGYTIYKVTERIICIDALEQSVKEAVVWRRFNDFQKLHKSLSSLHAALHRRESFPEFPRPQMFNRFDSAVICGRMQSAQDLLNFAGQRNYLISSNAFKEFFSGAQPVTPTNSDLLFPEKSALAVEEIVDVPLKPKADGKSMLEFSSGDDEHDSSELTHEQKVRSEESLDDDRSRTDLTEGFWCYRQALEETSSGGLGEEDDADSVGDNSLPDILDGTPTFRSALERSHLVLFDPLAGELEAPGQNELSNEFLLSTMTTEVERFEISQVKPDQKSDENASGVCSNSEEENPEPSVSSRYASDLADILGDAANEEPDVFSDQGVSSTFAPQPTRQSSIVESGKGDLTVSPLRQVEERKRSSVKGSSLHPLTGRAASPKKPSWTANLPYFNSQNKSGYIIEAGEQISQAKRLEAAGAYHEAFSQYRCGVGTLLKGVQKDGDEKQREAVRRKISVYLRKAEELYHEHLTNCGDESHELRWDLEHTSHFTEVDSSIALLRGVTSELGRFKVVGLVNKVLLVVDTGTDGNFIIKVLHKSAIPLRSQRTIVPTHIPYMVSLVRFFETDSAIYLVLQHAAGGTLWNYVSGYFGQFNQDKGQDLVADICSDQHEKLLRTAGRKSNVVSAAQIQNRKIGTDRGGDTTSLQSSKSKLVFNEPVSLTDLMHTIEDNDDSLLRSVSSNRPLDESPIPSLLKSPNHSRCSESTIICEQDEGSGVEISQEFRAVLESCKMDVNSYSICSVDSGDNPALSRLTSVGSDQMEAADGGVVEPVSSVVEARDDALDSCRHKITVDDSVDENGSLLRQLDSAPPQNVAKSDVVAAKACLNLSLTRISMSGANGDMTSMDPNHHTDFREPLRSPSMSRLSSQESDLSGAGGARRRCRTLSSVFAELDLASDVPSESRPTMQLPEGCIRQWAAELVVALSRLHSLGVICRDLHPGNILLGDSGHILLTYFSQWNTVDLHVCDEAINGLYCAPEVLGVSEITTSCDWWSLGAILFELFTGQSLRACYPAGLTAHSAINLPSHMSEEACSLIIELLKYNPAERLGSGIGQSDNIRSHPFFAGIQWNHLLG